MNTANSAKKIIDIIDAQSYEAGYSTGYADAEAKSYEEGYEACRLDYQKKAKDLKRLKKEEKRRRLYFLKQKTVGVFLLILTIFAVKLLDGDATISLLTVPIGLMLIFSKEKCWMDRYYFETEMDERRNR